MEINAEPHQVETREPQHYEYTLQVDTRLEVYRISQK